LAVEGGRRVRRGRRLSSPLRDARAGHDWDRESLGFLARGGRTLASQRRNSLGWIVGQDELPVHLVKRSTDLVTRLIECQTDLVACLI
jgi:hypothetical protein